MSNGGRGSMDPSPALTVNARGLTREGYPALKISPKNWPAGQARERCLAVELE